MDITIIVVMLMITIMMIILAILILIILMIMILIVITMITTLIVINRGAQRRRYDVFSSDGIDPIRSQGEPLV